jgi:serine/threonine-protein kinase
LAHSSDPITFRVLGPPELRAAGGPIGLTQPRRIAVLAYLALARPRGLQARDTLLALLWPEADQDAARHALRNCLHAIRRALGEDVIRTAGDGMVGVEPARLTCDALELEADLEAGRADSAIARYTGPLLQGFHVTDAPEFERWLEAERRRLHDAVAEAGWATAETWRVRGDLMRAAQVARRVHQLSPHDESSLRRLLPMLDACGDRAGAMRAYEEFADLLRQELDDVPAPETEALVARLRERAAAPAVGPIESLAVLPFANRTVREDGEELCDGLSAGVANRLARLARFHVRARGDVGRLPAPAGDAIAHARGLGVDALVCGTLLVRDSVAALRIEVIRVADARLLLGEAFAAKDAELVSLESHVALAVAGALGVTSSDELHRVAAGRPSRDGETYVLYVRGQHAFLRAAANGHPADLHRSREFFEQALDRDPEFAPAIAGLSNFYAVAAARNVIPPFTPTFGHAIELSRRAIALDPTLAIPHVHFGVQAMYLVGDWDAAGREFTRAVELDPSYPEGHRFLAVWLGLSGRREESLSHFRAAASLEPHMPIYANGLAAALMTEGRLAEAIDELRRALALDPRYWASRERLIRCYEQLGRWSDAVAERLRDERADGTGFETAWREGGEAGYQAARSAELRATIGTIEARLDATPSGDAGDLFNPPELRLALAHAELGQWDAAWLCEERASAGRPWRRRWFVAQPELAPLARRRHG